MCRGDLIVRDSVGREPGGGAWSFVVIIGEIMRLIDRVRYFLRGRGQDAGTGAARAGRVASRYDQPHEETLLPGDYWHFTSSSSVNFLFNNVWTGQGWLPSMSTVRRTHGDRFITLGDLYPLTGEAAEALWERVRAERFPQKPSRRGAMFLFDRRDLAAGSASKWKPDTDTIVLKVRISRDARVHMGHVGWFDTSEAPREADAARYWAGEPCPNRPDVWEHVVDGQVYFPDWREAPFAPFGGRPEETYSGSHSPVTPVEIVTCPVCGIDFSASPPSCATLRTADRSRCVEDPDLPTLCDCPNVTLLIDAAWNRMKASG
jgi:hypothetical protein